MKLTELLELTELPEEVEDLLREETLTREEEERILARTLAKAGLAPLREKGEGHRMKPSRFGLMLLAGVVCAGAVVASAAGYFTMNRNLARHLGAGEAEESLVSQAGGDLGQSATAAGWTITASQVLGDKTQMRVLLDVTAPEGTMLPEGHYRLELPMIDPSVTFTIDDVKDEDPADNRLSFVLSTIKARDYRGQTVKLHFGGVSRYKQYTLEELEAGASPLDVEKLVTADFDLSVKPDYRDTSVTYKPGVEVETRNGTVKVEEVTLSPLSVFVKLSGEGTRPRSGGAVAMGGGGTLRYNIIGEAEQDGGDTFEVLDRNGDPILWTTGDTEPDSITLTFAGIVDPADVAAIVLGGTEIPLAG